MNPNDTDGHQVGNGLGVEQPNTFVPNTGDAFNAPQAPIISSSPDPEDKKENSITRAFGGRSRASKIAAQAPVQPSNLRQNAPDFFQQSMQQQDIILNAAAEQKAKGKKGLLIGGIIGGIAIAIIITVVILFVALPGGDNTSTPKVNQYKDFLKNGIEVVSKYDDLLQAAEEDSIGFQVGITDEDYKESNNELTNIFNEIVSFRESLAEHLNAEIGDENTKKRINELEDELVSSLDSRISVYEKYRDTALALNEVYLSGGSDESIEALSRTSDSELLEPTIAIIQNFYAQKKSLMQKWSNNDCDNFQEKAVCASITESILELDSEYNTNKSLAKLFASYNNQDNRAPKTIMSEIVTIIEEMEENEE